ncbi:MAG: DUF2914 domain-containing protein [Candidatus Paceibacterota bacterium]
MRAYFRKLANTAPGRLAQRHWLTIAFIFGFATDFILLNKIDDIIDNLILLFYVTLSMFGIILLYAAAAGRLPDKWNHRARTFAAIAVQYAFGGLLSGIIIFYGRSASFGDSWPFLLIIAGIIYMNETVKDRSGRLVLTLSMYFIGLLAYTVLVLPVLLGKMGGWVFVGSGILAILVMAILLGILRLIIPNFLGINLRVVLFSIGSIFATFNFLYFLNVIPPIPLSLNDLGVYHSVIRFESGEYQLKYEKGEWWEFWKRSDTVFHPTPGGNAFCFARVFSPARLSTDIYHRWEYYDEETKKWVTRARINYPIHGGRSDGYRGYTQIGSYRDGKWRCSVETARGQVLGREGFEIDSKAVAEDLVTRVD